MEEVEEHKTLGCGRETAGRCVFLVIYGLSSVGCSSGRDQCVYLFHFQLLSVTSSRGIRRGPYFQMHIKIS